jgi:hypothetical protein
VRRDEYLEISESLSIVSTFVCVHTILRDNQYQFNMGLLRAYDRLPCDAPTIETG